MKLMAINDQMEMAFSGQAPQVDPISGNEVPPGSLPVEVRDDIDAKLSEGEYVVPADVVRFHGVKFFEDLRTEAKMGMDEMQAGGRIGGEPVGAAPMGSNPMGIEGISEEDIAMLEQALAGDAMPEAAMAEGGLMDKVAFAAMNDPLVNERINSKGMSVGFAAGGLTQSLYSDPTRIDSLIDKVMATAQTNPAFMEALSQRGVTINTTKASMEPKEMQQANTQPVALAHGGSVHASDTGFNPLGFGLGFSSFGPTTPAGQSGTIQVAYYNPTTGATMMIAHDATTNRPLTAVPVGFIMGSPPVVGAPVPDVGGGSGGGSGGGGNDGDMKTGQPDPVDPDAWKGGLDWTNSETLYQDTLDELNRPRNLIEGFLDKGGLGQGANANQLGKLQARINHLKTGGATDTQIQVLQDQWDKNATSLLGSTTGGPITGAILRYSQNYDTKQIADLIAEGGTFGGTDSSSSSSSAPEPKFDSKPDASGNITVNPRTGKTITGKVTSPGSTRGKSSVEKAEQKAGEARQEKARQERNKKASKEAGKSSTNEAGQINTEKFLKDFKGGVGGRAKGGLMQKKK
jgi:hypothetical protein